MTEVLCFGFQYWVFVWGENKNNSKTLNTLYNVPKLMAEYVYTQISLLFVIFIKTTC